MVCCACGDSTLEPSKVLSVAPEKQLRRLLLGTEARVTMPDVKSLFFQVTTSAVPAIVVHANEIQPRSAAFIELDFAADGRLPQELACLEVFEDNGSSPDVLHGVADRLQVPLGSPCVCVGLIVHVVVYQTHLGLLST